MKGLLIDPEFRYLIEGRKVFLSGGYPAVRVDGKTERLHRLIMEPPAGKGVDHINRNKLDVRRANLRICDQADNCLNVPAHKDSASGVRGVWFDRDRGQWTAQISHRKKRVHIGRFASKAAASAARKAKERELWGEYAPR